ncbi:MAG: undecaprenyl-diphosphate phosphatase [Candidatus Eisenbacteria bacterium]|nr:undecaprenyl-diphosphate phosphatase [Candidatus Eisenbacteria bacterium]
MASSPRAHRATVAAMLMTLAAEPILTPLQAIVLGAVQGLSELLPISSSAHLYLVPTLLGWPYAGVAFDVAMHAGTLLALVVAFWSDWLALFNGLRGPKGPEREQARQLFGMICVATVPGLVAGKVLGELEERLRSVPLQASMLLLFGILLWAADKFTKQARETRVPGWGAALAVGFAQCLALVPGVSRSGITMTAGRLSGLSRLSAARFSFMLSMPITLAAVLYTGLLKSSHLMMQLPVSTLLIGIVSSGVFGFIAIRFMLGMLKHVGFGVFAAYRVLVALALFAWVARH